MANVYRYIPTTAINFACKDFLQQKFVSGINPDKEKGRFFLGNLLSGGLAGATSLLFVYPLDYCRTRLGNDVSKQYKSLMDCVSKTFASDGLQGLYRGLSVSMVGIFVYRALYFGTYDSGKKWVFGDRPNEASVFKRFLFA